MVLEDGCSNLNTISKGIDVGDTILITIKLTNPNRLDRDVKNEWYRGPDPESILFVIDGKEVLQIFQSDNLCNHRIILTE